MTSSWRKHVVVFLACLSVLGPVLAACGKSNVAGGPVTLTISDYSPEQDAFHKAVAAEYHRLNPKVTIQWTSTAQAQYQQSLPLAFQSHQAPDIFFWKSDTPELTMATLLQQGWLHTLSPDGSVPQSWMARWPQGTFVNGINMSGGKVYGFPFTDTLIWGPGYMYFNKALFQQAGLDPANPPRTWNALKSACEAIVAKTGKYCLANPIKGTDFQRLWYPIAGSIMTDQFFDYKNGTFDLTNPKLDQAFSFIQSLYAANVVAPGVNDKTFSRQQMASGQAAIYFDGTWMPSTFQQLGFGDDKYGVAPPPYPDDVSAGALSIQNTENKYWVSSQTQHAQAAWDFIQWMTQPDGFFAQNYLAGNFGTLAYADNKKYLNDPALQTIYNIATTTPLRVHYPEPILKCPDLAKSQAFIKAEAVNPNGEWQVLVDALVNHKDLATAAQQIVQQRQGILTSTLQSEAATGMKVSIACYTFQTGIMTSTIIPATIRRANDTTAQADAIATAHLPETLPGHLKRCQRRAVMLHNYRARSHNREI